MTGPDAGAPAQERTKAQKIIHRTKVGGALAVAVGLLLWGASQPVWGPWLTAVMALGLTLVGAHEIDRMGLFPTGRGKAGVLAGALTALGMLVFLPAHVGWVLALTSSWLAGLGVAVGTAGVGAEFRRQAPAMGILSVMPVATLPLLYLYPVRAMGGAGALAALVGLAKIGDIAGYFGGNAFGRRKAFPKLSPGKTIEGCAASLLAGIAAGAALTHFGAFGTPRYGIVSGLLFGIVINLAAQAGDLAESALKRRAGVKDSGTTFGPSGGMLDLVDSFLLAAPLAAFIGPLLFHWAPL